MKAALVLACDDNFIAYTSCVARRIAHYASERFPIFVVSDGVTDENKRAAQTFCPQIEFIELSHRFAGKNLPLSGHFTRAAYARLLLDDVLPLERAVYIDSDVSVMTDLSALLATHLDLAPIAAAIDNNGYLPDTSFRSRLGMSPGAAYFNSGVVVYDLKAIRASGLFKRALEWSLANPGKCEFVDQDALNAVVDGRFQVLDWRWNVTSAMFQNKAPFIRHFTGAAKPWRADTGNIERIYIDQWRADLDDSPWPLAYQLGRDRPERPLKAIERRIKTLAHIVGRGRAGNEARFIHRVGRIHAENERAAKAGELAPAFPERAYELGNAAAGGVKALV